MNRYGAWLDGEEIPGEVGQTIVNPADGEAFATVANVSPAHLERAFEGAERARVRWGRLDAQERAQHLAEWARHLVLERHHLAALEAKQSGQPFLLAQKSVDAALEFLEAFAAERLSLSPPNRGGLWLGRPMLDVGIANLPGRYPLAEALYAMAPALVAGTSVVLFPARTSPLTILEAARLGSRANLPPGLINVVPGGDEAAHRLRREPHNRFTRLPVPSEPGEAPSMDRNKGTMVVFRDAALAHVVDQATAAAFTNTGQDGWGVSRILVEDEMFGPFMDALVSRADALRVGHPAETGVEMGPLRSRAHREMAFQQVLEALDMGAQPALGAQRYPAAMAPGGYFYPPTILFHLDPSWSIIQSGVDGPVVTVLSFSGLEQAQSLLERFGSSTISFWSRDPDRLQPLLASLSAPVIQVQAHWTTIELIQEISRRSDLRQAMMARLGPRQGLVVGPADPKLSEGDAI